MSERHSRSSGPFATLPSECVSRDGRDREVVLVCPTRRVPQGALPLLDSAVPEPHLGDAVVVVEPGDIAGETARGLRTLYVALTRPTQRLTVVSSGPPPAPLVTPI